MLEMGVPVGLGTDATRVASYNPWVALSWLVTGKTVGGLSLYPEHNRVDRQAALELYTRGSAWMSREDDVKGSIAPGQYADFTALSADYFEVPDDEIRDIASVLTVVDGKVVYGAEEFSQLAPPLPPASPDWAPARSFGGYAKPAIVTATPTASAHSCVSHKHSADFAAGRGGFQSLWGPFGCGCWAY